MAVTVKVNMLAGALCTVATAADATVRDLKELIRLEAGVPTSEQKLVLSHAVMEDMQTLRECGVVEEAAEVLLIRGHPYNGTYMCKIIWNRSPTLQILNERAKISWDGTNYIEGELKWESPRDAAITVQNLTHRDKAVEWRRLHGCTETGERMISETFALRFHGDSADGGFCGKFSDGGATLDLTGRFLHAEVPAM
eukprot:NODE_22044_length_725_cov_2.881271.p1 GENE.NODE_22044_length_725_cov_2.881271~~NODE_22044_length_725_cov_2.881271.p1  ORF type:complete len:196 (+),score=27.98 NODE_22044_length_725_cov_2.881271:121-708(+)